MRQRIIAVVVIIALGAGIATLVWQKKRGPGHASHEKMVEQFIAILPDSLDNDHILEIRQLFYALYEREKLGKVKPETSKEVTDQLAIYIEQGQIGRSDLIHFMAEVGYKTYKDDERYNLEDGSVDHPVLNPEVGGRLGDAPFDSTQYDSTFWADFEKWKKENPELLDSMATQPHRRPGRPPGSR